MMRSNGTILGPLHGIPIIVKDNIATAMTNSSSMNTTAGSYALLGSVPPGDSTVAAKLKKAGAIILGKANLSQWANYRSTNGYPPSHLKPHFPHYSFSSRFEESVRLLQYERMDFERRSDYWRILQSYGPQRK